MATLPADAPRAPVHATPGEPEPGRRTKDAEPGAGGEPDEPGGDSGPPSGPSSSGLYPTSKRSLCEMPTFCWSMVPESMRATLAARASCSAVAPGRQWRLESVVRGN